MNFLDIIIRHSLTHPDTIAVRIYAENATDRQEYTYYELLAAALNLAEEIKRLKEQEGRVPIGLVMANSMEWVVADLALLLSGSTEVPVPFGFTAQQSDYLLKEATVCLVDAAGDQRLAAWEKEWPGGSRHLRISVDIPALIHQLNADIPRFAEESICKIIHTSGTTDRPKGVQIRLQAIDTIIKSLKNRLGNKISEQYLSIVPLSLLIEQVAGIYMTLTAGGTIVFLSPTIKLLGNEGINANRFIPLLKDVQPTAMAVPPALIEALYVYIVENNIPAHHVCQEIFGSKETPFISCGGAPVSVQTLVNLITLGIPVFEGYGLSENSSVVSINSPEHYKIGTVGKPLDHVEVKLAADQELLIQSKSVFAGYVGSDPSACAFDAHNWLKTGDLAEIDQEGYIRIIGRKKNIIILNNGRNVSPEWIESRYNSLPFIEATVVFGNTLHALKALFFIREDQDEQEAERAIRDFGCNQFSEVEMIRQWVIVRNTPEIASEFFTVTGRPMRNKMWECFVQEPVINL
jgi:long-subunit acyl-CoA synthetase (AMP-forming)